MFMQREREGERERREREPQRRSTGLKKSGSQVSYDTKKQGSTRVKFLLSVEALRARTWRIPSSSSNTEDVEGVKCRFELRGLSCEERSLGRFCGVHEGCPKHLERHYAKNKTAIFVALGPCRITVVPDFLSFVPSF